MVNGQRGLEWGRSGHIELWLRLNFTTKEAKCGQSQFVRVSASRKDEPNVQVRLVVLTLGFRKQNIFFLTFLLVYNCFTMVC